jgi:hypothetical protein
MESIIKIMMKFLICIASSIKLVWSTSSYYETIGMNTNPREEVEYKQNHGGASFKLDNKFLGRRLDSFIGLSSRNNQGYDLFMEHFHDVSKSRLQVCPDMVGPLEDGKFYCTSKYHGYCDRRSGTCFCNKGYSGQNCKECDPLHIDIGDLCYEKKFCPNDCSGAGTCDYLSGICKCNIFRDGADCSQFVCEKYDQYCTQCNKDKCLQCIDGYSVNEEGFLGHQCEPCSRFDPRCNECNSHECLGCIDLLLLSISRSGRRLHDPILPPDEVERQLSKVMPFGTQQDDYFDDAEDYKLVDKELTPLNRAALACDQGIHDDSSFVCRHVSLSNKVCGHEGMFSFSSPEYHIVENQEFVRLTIKRSGGGAGVASVSYSLEDLTTDKFYRDVSPTAHYTDLQTITFYNHEVQKSFLLPIHNDLWKV